MSGVGMQVDILCSVIPLRRVVRAGTRTFYWFLIVEERRVFIGVLESFMSR